MDFVSTLSIEPTLPIFWLGVMACVALILLGYAYWQNTKAVIFRFLLLATLFLLLLNPAIISENRTFLKDIVLLVIDETTSQSIGARAEQAKQAKKTLLQELQKLKDVEVQVISVTSNSTALSESAGGTHLFKAREIALETLPKERLAATVIVTDGQVHDAVEMAAKVVKGSGPIHTVITGTKGEVDRVITVDIAPSYGIIGKSVQIKYKVEDFGPEIKPKTVVLTARLDGEVIKRVATLTGRSEDLGLIVPHGGANHVILSVEPLSGEISEKNNTAVVSINGIRDRLKVLLISGEPHIGERGWRNILKSDPSVDLIHFTILRPPEKQDGTPLKELSLIPFPIIELFEQKLNEFDLIVFDRYRKRGVLSPRYLNNIVSYVENGGALLEAAGPSFASPLSLYGTSLASILPGRPTGSVFEQPYVPRLNEIGLKHPVTASLSANGRADQWGRWFRLIDTNIKAGTVLMTGSSDRPLLILNRQGEGRVAQLMSDHAWLWGRGFDGGGPQAELFRRIAHWLMKEPELEEEQLTAKRVGGKLEITRRSLSDLNDLVMIRYPDGKNIELKLQLDKSGIQIGSVPISVNGLYKLSSTGIDAFVAVGSPNPLEERNVRATDKYMQPIAIQSGGGIHWIADGALPSFKRTSPTAQQSTNYWWGLRANKQYSISGYTKTQLIPPLLVVFLLIGSMCILWWREGR
ncbi:hypothetical protein A9Q83_09935 [Alphaproteobacteria bacterium 46_93_T64]|nr:hypothetical protein A9Q83_09935 [Alphaproteobacteria bacterium 46_93_T64]